MKMVSEVMSSNPRTVSQTARASDAARIMLEEDVGSLPVIDDGAVVGIVTDRDVALRVVATGRDPETTTVDEIASRDVLCVTPDYSLDDVYERMTAWQVRRLPVVHEGQLVGIVAQADLVRELKDKKAGQLVGEISRPGKRLYGSSAPAISAWKRTV